MTVYVDALMKHGWKMRGQPVRNCHLFTDGPIEELHALAKQVGMRRTWFQEENIPHYDLTAARRRAAVLAGAVEVDRRQACDIWARIRKARCALIPGRTVNQCPSYSCDRAGVCSLSGEQNER